MAALLDEARIAEIVERVVERLARRPAGPVPSSPQAIAPAAAGKNASKVPRGTLGIYADPDQAVAAARRGFEANEKAPIELRRKMITAMREVTYKHLRELAGHAVDETGLGRFEDKIGKNKLVADKTPGVEILRPVAFTGDDGLML